MIPDGRRCTAARQGLASVGERAVFAGLDTSDNLRVGRVTADRAVELFPELEKRLKTGAGMLSLGLAPLVVDRLLRAVREAADRGLGALLAEQHVRKVLDIADRVYVLRRGRLELTGTPRELRGNMAAIESSYLAEGPARQHAEDQSSLPDKGRSR